MPESAGLAEESTEERKAAKKGFFPSSMGLSFLVPEDSDTLSVTVRWADYRPVPIEDDDGKATSVWQREQNEHTEPVSLERAGDYDIADSGGLTLHAEVRPIDTAGIAGIPAGTRSISVFLVNRRKPDEDNPDLAYAFQAEIEVQGERAFVPRPDLRGAQAEDWDEQVADLHYADMPKFATGHGVSADWDIVDGVCRRLRTAADGVDPERFCREDRDEGRPRHRALDGGTRCIGRRCRRGGRVAAAGRRVSRMDRRAARRDGSTSGRTPRYGRGPAAPRRPRRGQGRARHRVAGVERGRTRCVPGGEPGRRERAPPAPRRAVRRSAPAPMAGLPARVHSVEPAGPRGPARSAPRDRGPALLPDRRRQDGGVPGSRSLHDGASTPAQPRPERRSGRRGEHHHALYTLRLLTLDQLARASGLVCALELEREADAARYGEWPFEIGLWVGKAATPNLMGHKGEKRSDSARAKTRRFRTNPRGNPSPIPLENCPWCGTRFEPDSFALLPDDDRPKELRVVCANFECDFSGDRPLPILAVDESIYRRLPAFLIATADKFASLPWVAETGKLLGGAQRFDKNGFLGPSERGGGQRLDRPLPPPDLVIQDELHLISGPLGTMVGLYEAAIEALCIREVDGRKVRPKIVASTATVRHAQNQIQALFARSMTQIFPPPGPDRRHSFFARSVPAEKTAYAQRYLSEFEYRFNRRFDLPDIIPRLVYVALRTPPMPERLLKLRLA